MVRRRGDRASWPMSETVVVTGAAGPVGRRVAALAAADDAGRAGRRRSAPASIAGRHAAVDRGPAHRPRRSRASRRCWPRPTSLVHLGARRRLGPDGLPSTVADRRPGRRRARCRRCGGGRRAPRRLAVDGMVYGAWGNNPVPLTEDAPLRPDPGLASRRPKAESRAAGRRVAARPTGRRRGRGAAPGGRRSAPRPIEWLARSPWSAAALRASGTERAEPVPPPRRPGVGGRPRPPRAARRAVQRGARRVAAAPTRCAT